MNFPKFYFFFKLTKSQTLQAITFFLFLKKYFSYSYFIIPNYFMIIKTTTNAPIFHLLTIHYFLKVLLSQLFFLFQTNPHNPYCKYGLIEYLH